MTRVAEDILTDPPPPPADLRLAYGTEPLQFGDLRSADGDGLAIVLHGGSWKLKHALDRWPRASWRLARTALVWRTVERLLLGDLASPGEQHGLARAPLRALALLGR